MSVTPPRSKPEVEEVEEAAQDVVQQDGDQQKDSAHGDAHDEDGLGEIDSDQMLPVPHAGT